MAEQSRLARLDAACIRICPYAMYSLSVTEVLYYDTHSVRIVAQRLDTTAAGR
jgi:hypothetical protein